MTLRNYSNAPATTLALSAGSTDTTMVVSSATGYPAAPFIAIIDRGTTAEEVVLVTATSGAGSTTWTVTRGYDSSTNFSHASGAAVVHGISALDPREANIHVNATGSVHGVSGTLVGTTDTQALTNKTISGTANSIDGMTPSKFLVTDATGKLVTSAQPAQVTTGDLVGTSDSQALTNKTIDVTANDINGGSSNDMPKFDATGKLVDSGLAAPASAIVGVDDAQTLTNKTLDAPVITDGFQVNGTSFVGGGTGIRKILFGSTVVNMNNNNAVSKAVHFGSNMPDTAYAVMLTIGTGVRNLNAEVDTGVGLAVDGFTIDVRTTDNTNSAATPTVWWFVIG